MSPWSNSTGGRCTARGDRITQARTLRVVTSPAGECHAKTPLRIPGIHLTQRDVRSARARRAKVLCRGREPPEQANSIVQPEGRQGRKSGHTPLSPFRLTWPRRQVRGLAPPAKHYRPSGSSSGRAPLQLDPVESRGYPVCPMSKLGIHLTQPQTGSKSRRRVEAPIAMNRDWRPLAWGASPRTRGAPTGASPVRAKASFPSPLRGLSTLGGAFHLGLTPQAIRRRRFAAGASTKWLSRVDTQFRH